MARKLRLEKGDFVTLKVPHHPKGFILGRVDKVYKNDKDTWKDFGIYGYTILWDWDEASNSGWSLKDITVGRLKYVKNRKAIEALYGSKNIQKD